MTDRYVVAGNPIKHSKSPEIHAAFAKATGQDLTYGTLMPEVGQFDQTATAFFNEGGLGMNVTVPFKLDAFALAKHATERARLAGAVNTLYLNDQNEICADNTDGFGLLRDVSVNYQVPVAGKRILILGAGGAVRGVLKPFLDERPSEIVIANRTVSKAQALADQFADYGNVSACGFDACTGVFDLIINGTSASLSGDLPPVPAEVIGSNTVCYDMMYGAKPTPFMVWALDQGAAQAIDGLGMLIEQAAEAFTIWRGVRPDTTDVTRSIRNQLTTV